MSYNWQQDNWPEFTYDLALVEDDLYELTAQAGRISGLVKGLPDGVRNDAVLDVMVAEAIKTSEIEGEYLSRKDVMSSIRNNLGLSQTPEQVGSQKAEGAALLMIDVRESFNACLNEEKLFAWHRMIMQGSYGFNVGGWRSHKEPMQVISGSMGKQKVHFEAPPSDRVSAEMLQYIQWFNETAPDGPKAIKKPAIRAAIAHLFFESIHPFEDGNGRIGRALSEKALFQGAGQPLLISLSRSIESHKQDYYKALQTAQSSNEITGWIQYFLCMVLEAQIIIEQDIEFILKKTRLFDQHSNHINDRQKRVINRMLEEGPGGFEGGMSAKKYMAITHTSKATATRDLQDLVDKGVFVLLGGGRSTHYEIRFG